MSVPPVLIHRVIARLNVGGPAMHVVNLAGSMGDGRWRTRLIAGRIEEAEGDMTYYAEGRAVDITYVPALARSISPLDDVRTLLRLYRLFRREKPTIVHTHTAKAGTLGRLAAVLAGVPVRVHTYHGHVLGGDYFSAAKTRFFLEVERQLARVTDRLVVLTHTQAGQMAEDLAVAPRDRFAVVPLGLDLSAFASVDRDAVRAEVRAELGLGDDELVVGIVGRMVPIKNHELYVRLVGALAAREGRPVRGLVVGAGERDEAVISFAQEQGFADKLLWLGWRRDLHRLYPAMDVLTLTSHDEGTPVAVIEALATGTRVVARGVGGVREVLESVGAGTVVPREAGPEEWADAVLAAAATPAPLQARGSVVERFSVVRLTRDLAALYDGLLAQRGLGS